MTVTQQWSELSWYYSIATCTHGPLCDREKRAVTVCILVSDRACEVGTELRHCRYHPRPTRLCEGGQKTGVCVSQCVIQRACEVGIGIELPTALLYRAYTHDPLSV